MSSGLLDQVAHAFCISKRMSLRGELGQGAFKKAYEVVLDGESLALKVTELLSSSVDRLGREIDALRLCDHTGVAKIFKAENFEYEGRRFLVVLEEFLRGGTLESRIERRTLLPGVIKEIGGKLADVLRHLNDKRLVHRDIKPANILFRDGGYIPVLTDFGIVRVLDSPSLTKDFLVQGPGTPFFASPEQLNNQKHLVDWRTDQFGLAVSLAYCATGLHPYQANGESERDAIVAVAARRPLPSERISELEALQLGFLVKSLGAWPISRYRRPTDLIDAFQ